MLMPMPTLYMAMVFMDIMDMAMIMDITDMDMVMARGLLEAAADACYGYGHHIGYGYAADTRDMPSDIPTMDTMGTLMPTMDTTARGQLMLSPLLTMLMAMLMVMDMDMDMGMPTMDIPDTLMPTMDTLDIIYVCILYTALLTRPNITRLPDYYEIQSPSLSVCVVNCQSLTGVNHTDQRDLVGARPIN